MRILLRVPFLIGLLLPLQPGLSLRARAEAPPAEPLAAMVARVTPAVVKIISVRPPKKDAETPPQGPTTAASDDRPMLAEGSGFIIDPSGFVATNKHVVADSIALFVLTNDGIRFKAKVVGVTAKADIALLKIDSDKPFPSVGFGDSDKVRPGDTAIVIGSPLGFNESVSAGVVSAVNRDIMESPFDDYIQTDAAINHGNSGGPLFNTAGEVIGMNSVLFAPGTYSGSVGLGFAIPSNELRFVFDRLMTEGAVRAGMLPIRTQQVKWMLGQAIGAPGLNGAMVVALDDADDKMLQGKIKPGDDILTFDGEPVLDPRDLARKAARRPAGSDATLELFRDGQRFQVHVTIQAWPEGKPPVLHENAPNTLGLKLTGGPNGAVQVADIDPSGSAADSGIQKGDVVVQVQAQPVSDPDQALRAVLSDQHGFAAVLVDRKGQRTWIAIAVPSR